MRVSDDPPHQAKVQDLYAAFVIDDAVVGLEVTMDQARGMRRREALAGLDIGGHELSPAALDARLPMTQRNPADELHRQEQAVGVFADLVKLHHVGVRQPSQRLGLAQQPRTLEVIDEHIGV
ncbi:MAG: hypothetical protein AAGF11_04280 [Myxococcota bacterium]